MLARAAPVRPLRVKVNVSAPLVCALEYWSTTMQYVPAARLSAPWLCCMLHWSSKHLWSAPSAVQLPANTRTLVSKFEPKVSK